MWLGIGGFACGFIAGVAAQHGRMCTMTAIEDAIVSRDFRSAKAWGLALAVSLVATLAAMRFIGLTIEGNVYASGVLDLGGALLGGVLFGLGMSLVGTCSFGLLVRTGSGDLRAFVSAVAVGIAAFAFTGGILSRLRLSLSPVWAADPDLIGGTSLPAVSLKFAGGQMVWHQFAWVLLIAAILLIIALRDARLRRRPRMMISAVSLGLAVSLGWTVTAIAVDAMETRRLESLSFVVPVGRLLMQVMSEGLRDVGFGVASVAGVVSGAFATALVKNELRPEAFDDSREMRRHLLGALLMGCGGVLARGCTIGQGMSAASALVISAPVVIAGVLIGARAGLWFLLEGRLLLARSPFKRDRV